MRRKAGNLITNLTILAVATGCATTAANPLPSWNNGATKAAITGFVEPVSNEGSPYFVPVEEGVAVFDNDGTLWGGARA